MRALYQCSAVNLLCFVGLLCFSNLNIRYSTTQQQPLYFPNDNFSLTAYYPNLVTIASALPLVHAADSENFNSDYEVLLKDEFSSDTYVDGDGDSSSTDFVEAALSNEDSQGDRVDIAANDYDESGSSGIPYDNQEELHTFAFGSEAREHESNTDSSEFSDDLDDDLDNVEVDDTPLSEALNEESPFSNKDVDHNFPEESNDLFAIETEENPLEDAVNETFEATEFSADDVITGETVSNETEIPQNENYRINISPEHTESAKEFEHLAGFKSSRYAPYDQLSKKQREEAVGIFHVGLEAPINYYPDVGMKHSIPALSVFKEVELFEKVRHEYNMDPTKYKAFPVFPKQGYSYDHMMNAFSAYERSFRFFAKNLDFESAADGPAAVTDITPRKTLRVLSDNFMKVTTGKSGFALSFKIFTPKKVGAKNSCWDIVLKLSSETVESFSDYGAFMEASPVSFQAEFCRNILKLSFGVSLESSEERYHYSLPSVDISTFLHRKLNVLLVSMVLTKKLQYSLEVHSSNSQLHSQKGNIYDDIELIKITNDFEAGDKIREASSIDLPQDVFESLLAKVSFKGIGIFMQGVEKGSLIEDVVFDEAPVKVSLYKRFKLLLLPQPKGGFDFSDFVDSMEEQQQLMKQYLKRYLDMYLLDFGETPKMLYYTILFIVLLFLIYSTYTNLARWQALFAAKPEEQRTRQEDAFTVLQEKETMRKNTKMQGFMKDTQSDEDSSESPNQQSKTSATTRARGARKKTEASPDLVYREGSDAAEEGLDQDDMTVNTGKTRSSIRKRIT